MVNIFIFHLSTIYTNRNHVDWRSIDVLHNYQYKFHYNLSRNELYSNISTIYFKSLDKINNYNNWIVDCVTSYDKMNTIDKDRYNLILKRKHYPLNYFAIYEMNLDNKINSYTCINSSTTNSRKSKVTNGIVSYRNLEDINKLIFDPIVYYLLFLFVLIVAATNYYLNKEIDKDMETILGNQLYHQHECYRNTVKNTISSPYKNIIDSYKNKKQYDDNHEHKVQTKVITFEIIEENCYTHEKDNDIIEQYINVCDSSLFINNEDYQFNIESFEINNNKKDLSNEHNVIKEINLPGITISSKYTETKEDTEIEDVEFFKESDNISNSNNINTDCELLDVLNGIPESENDWNKLFKSLYEDKIPLNTI